jgi:hypothetical protein
MGFIFTKCNPIYVYKYDSLKPMQILIAVLARTLNFIFFFLILKKDINVAKKRCLTLCGIFNHFAAVLRLVEFYIICI